MIIKISNPNEKAKICRNILDALPDWFEIPESIDEYVNGCKTMPLWADIENNTARGFIVMKETSPHTAEICVMGVLP